MSVFPRQAAILCGGSGTRLGVLTAHTPKPLLDINGAPFLETLIREVSRSGIRRFLLLAGHLSAQVEDFARSLQARLGSGYTIEVNVEREPAGTGGALFDAKDRLDELFLLLNGDSFLDFPIHALGRILREPDLLGAIALRRVPDVSRYGSVAFENGKVICFREKIGQRRAGLINGGVYLLRRESLRFLNARSSLEQEFLPELAQQGLLGAQAFDGFFIDIGLPETYAEAGRNLMTHRRRPAAFLDRDGVLNRDAGYVGTIGRWRWTDNAIDAVRRLNHAGFYVFVATNQAGIAKGKYELDDYWRLRDAVREQLFHAGAQIDDERFCPYHPDGTREEWRALSDWRKPAPGMLKDLLDCWPVEREASFLIGDQPSDLEAAKAVGIKPELFEGGDLDAFVRIILER